MSELNADTDSVSEEKTDPNSREDEIEPSTKPQDLLGRDYVRSILNRDMIILTKDSRVLRGKFHCTDNHLNIILQGCDEFQNVAQLGENESKKKRHHSLLIVPERYIAKILLVKG